MVKRYAGRENTRPADRLPGPRLLNRRQDRYTGPGRRKALRGCGNPIIGNVDVAALDWVQQSERPAIESRGACAPSRNLTGLRDYCAGI